jgi:hypothetical protein
MWWGMGREIGRGLWWWGKRRRMETYRWLPVALRAISLVVEKMLAEKVGISRVP